MVQELISTSIIFGITHMSFSYPKNQKMAQQEYREHYLSVLLIAITLMSK